MSNKPIFLKEEIVKKNKKKVVPEDIVDCICNLYNITPEQIRSKTRKKEVRSPRQILCFLIKKYIKIESCLGEKKDISLQNIGDVVCKNHATVLHSLGVVKDSYETNKKFKEEIEKIELIVSRLFSFDENVEKLDIDEIVDNLPKNKIWISKVNRDTYINCSYELLSYGVPKEKVSVIIKNLYQAAKYEQ